MLAVLATLFLGTLPVSFFIFAPRTQRYWVSRARRLQDSVAGFRQLQRGG